MDGADPPPAAGAAPRRGRPPKLSRNVVVGAAIALLDSAGESALTFRALAAELHTGVGGIYHYVASKDEVLDAATNEILGRVVAAADLPADPYEALRVLSMDLYLAMQAHPWSGAYLMRDTGMQPNSMRLFELFGRQVMRLNLTPRQTFDAVSSLVSFVVGVGAEMRQLPAEKMVEGKTQAEYLQEIAQEWRSLDPEEFPFVHAVADEFATHDDVEQFRAGVDLFLAGLARRASCDAAPES
ncbi:MAG: helix-turn-helix domain-containing protein [Tetrasphaera sp.]